jgi:DNA (cytosine-5)-methyltransferase 1
MRLLDLFCGAGGAGMGYHRAGFDVVGVDIEQQKRYPFEFHQGDALEFCLEHGHTFDVIHASPPCQAYSKLRFVTGGEYPELIDATRAVLEEVGIPWVIENVAEAPLRNGVMLCGGMFGLRTYRHRLFESSVFMFQPHHPKHVAKTSMYKRKKDWDAGMHISVTGDVSAEIAGLAMGIDWMVGRELREAIPPSYTEWIGTQLRNAIDTDDIL